MRIVVAMSGGVDSAVAAGLVADEGHDVIGVSMQLYDQRPPSAGNDGLTRFGSCCTLDDLHDARKAAHALGVPHYIMNFERQFDAHVVQPFVEAYISGRTPIPCSHCNSELKFSTLLERAGALGADALATGHYARVEYDEDGRRYRLRRGRDRARDQSYFLFSLTQAQLARARFPVGHLEKAEVREYARARRLPVADKAESREICFVPDGDYASFVEQRAGSRSPAQGDIVDSDGRRLGTHRGVHRFTVGQRKGLGVSAAIPLYVVGLEPESNRVVVGPKNLVERRGLVASGVNWIDGEPPASPRRVAAQVRYKHVAAPGTLTPLGSDAARLVFDMPQAAIAPGQAVVFYDDDAVIGGGWIDRTE
jgi:tRNA-specific 2-thiouridylase